MGRTGGRWYGDNLVIGEEPVLNKTPTGNSHHGTPLPEISMSSYALPPQQHVRLRVAHARGLGHCLTGAEQEQNGCNLVENGLDCAGPQRGNQHVMALLPI